MLAPFRLFKAWVQPWPKWMPVSGTWPKSTRLNRLWSTPSSSTPAATATGRLTRRATTATENASTTSKVKWYGSSGEPDASSTPVAPASPQPNPQEMRATRLASMADSSASSRRSTTARISVPIWVRLNSIHSSTQTTRVNTRTNSWSKPSRTSPPNCSERPLTIRDPWRTMPVQILNARPRHSRNTPSVATSFSGVEAPLRSSGRNTTRSRSTPMPGPTTRRAIGAAITRGQCHCDRICQYM